MGGEDSDKIVRIPGETLLIKVTPEEVKYRNKYLPDPTKLTDEKLVCTVCSVSLAQNIHKGKPIFNHLFLHVLVCESCFNFYGDGCFSTDEDGDDKYCRWCGQGGSLFLCSGCTCAFCEKCLKQNLKASVLADLDNDDWKCYVCNPRPLFGLRAICWGAGELNKAGKEKEQEKLKKQKERLEEKKKEETGRKSRKHSSSEGEVTSKKRKLRADDSDSTSPEVVRPTKRPKRHISIETKNVNGSLNHSRKKGKILSSEDLSSEEEKKVAKHLRNKKKKNKTVNNDSSSEDDDSDLKNRRKIKSKKKRAKNSSEESSIEDYKSTKRRSRKKTADSSDDESTDEKNRKKKKLSKKKKEDTSDVSSDEKKKKLRRHKKELSEDSSDDNKNKSRKLRKKKDESSDSESDESSKKKKISKFKKDTDDKKKNEIHSDSGEGAKRKKNDDETLLEEKSEEIRSKDSSIAVDTLVKKRIKLAILWLDTAMKDIAELGSLIALRATKFAKKKINCENLKSYEDVLSTVSKLKQLMSGIHSNYDHIEKNLEGQLKPWKILTGLEESETEKPAEEEPRLSPDDSVSECQSISDIARDLKNGDEKAENVNIPTDLQNSTSIVETVTENVDETKTKTDIESNDLSMKWDNLSGDEDSENENLKVTEAITKASETLDKLDEQENLQTNKNNDLDSKPPEMNKNNSSPNMDDTMAEDLDQNNVTNVLDNSSKGSQSESDGKNSDTENEKSKKSGYKSLIGSSKSDYKSQERKGSKEKENVLKKQKSNKKDEDGTDSDSKISHNKERLPQKSCLKKERKEKNGEDSISKNSSFNESPGKDLKEQSQCAGTSECGRGEKTANTSNSQLSSSDESAGLESFGERLKQKWSESGDQSEEMKLKTSIGLDSSGEDDNGFEPMESEKPKELKKKTKDNGESSPKAKKVKQNEGKSKQKERNSLKQKETKEKSNKSRSKKDKRKEVADESDEENVSDDENKHNTMSEDENEEKDCEQSSIELKKKTRDNGESSPKAKKVKHNEGKSKQKERNSLKQKETKERNNKSRSKKDKRKDENKHNTMNEEVKEEEDGDQSRSGIGEDKGGNGVNLENETEVENVKIVKDESEIEDNSKEIIKNFKNEGVNKSTVIGLDSSTEDNENQEIKDECDEQPSEVEVEPITKSKGKEKKLKKKSVRNQRRSKKSNLLESSDEEDERSAEEEKDDQLILSSDEDNKESKEEKEDKDYASPVEVVSSAESSDLDLVLKRKKPGSSDSDEMEVSGSKKTKKRKLIRCANSSDESGGSDNDNLDASQKSTQGESPGKGGRKNIKKIKGKGDLEDATIEAAEEEKERRRRVEERQKLFQEMFQIKETKILDKLVLDIDEKDKKELISVQKELVEKMKPHQAKGVKFMWDSCFESIAQLKKKKGSGCILAHCMGLGKTFQVISLVHTLLTNDETQVHTVMVVCPLSTVLNWYNEFDKWLEGVEGGDSIEVFHLTKCKLNPERARELRRWQHNGGVMIMGYEMFRNLTCETAKKFKAKIKKDFQETLVDPGADLIVCDEGHMLKNENTALSKAMSKVKTLRRIVLTGTPMQNNLKEYHCMVQFVKPNLLGTRKEFLNRFVNPISNGQFVDSTESDVKLMKRRAHVLHKMLEGLVQRFDYNVLTPFLPPKHEYVISLCLSELQVRLYRHYLENFSQQSDSDKAGSRLFQDWQALGRIWTHPRVLKMSTDRANFLKEKKMMEESDEEGSLKDFIDDGSESDTTPEESSDNSLSDGSIKSNDGKKKKITTNRRNTRSTRSNTRNTALLESSDEEKGAEEPIEESTTDRAWWGGMVEPEHLDDINQSAKLVLLFNILKECEMIEDKVLVFSQSLFSLDLIEYFLDKIDLATQENRLEESLGNHQGTWAKGLDYFRLDGSTSSENRNIWCKAFNREDNTRARLFLISTRAGGLGINLTAANRVIIFDASWNPSHDVQSIFRVYRFGQRKPCYVYRFIAHGTMEEKVYDRQVAKQSMSNRVVDEQQVHRHFSMNDLNELYSFTPPTSKEERPTPALPSDGLMAEVLTQNSDWIEKYHEHDSLLENVVEEELNEEERKAAWEDYENDKKRGFIPQTTGNTVSGMYNNPMSLQIENLQRALKAKYPTKSEQELHQMLIYQVSVMMRQQQLAAQGQMGMNTQRPQMFPTNNLTPEQLFNLQQQQLRMQYLQQLQMGQQQQQPQQQASRGAMPSQPDYQQQMLMQQQANLARLQMQQMQQKMSQGLLQNQLTQPNHLAKLLQNPPMASGAAAKLQNISQNYQATKKLDSSVGTNEQSSKPGPAKPSS